GYAEQRLNPTRAKILKRSADKIDNSGEFRDLTLPANVREFLSDNIDNQRPRQVDLAQRIQNFAHRRNGSAGSRFHFVVHIKSFRRRVIRPMTAAQGVRAFLSKRETTFSRDSGTQSSKPPLVCASARNVR